MKKNTFKFLFFSILFINNSFAQQPDLKKGWPAAERKGFILSCTSEAKAAMSEDSARFYCYCMLEKLETKYPNIEDAAKITITDMESEAWKTDIKSCLTGFWSTASRDAFLSECSKSAKKDGMNEDKSNTYCACMLQKVELKYPNPIEAGELTAEKLNSPEWKKLIEGCMSF